MKLLKLYKQAGILVFFAIELIVFSLLSPVFLNMGNMINLFRQVAMLGIASVGVTFVMLGGSGADLSVAGQIPVLSMFAGTLIVNMGMPVWVVMIATLVFGIVLGYINGKVVEWLKINPFVVTLSTMTILSGVALLFTNGVSISGFPSSFSWLGQGYVGPVPAPIIILVLCVAVAQFVLSKTYLGRYIYALGGNSRAAYLAGINTNRIRLYTFMISGFFVAISGLMIASRTMIASPTAGSSYAFDCMTACVLGGISFAGGEGKLWGAFMGVLIIGTLSNGLTILNVGSYWQDIIKGVILVVALYMDRKQREMSIA